MFEYIAYKRKLNRLFRERTEIRESFRAKVNELKLEGADRDGIDSLNRDQDQETAVIDFEIEQLSTGYYLDLAHTHMLEVPDQSDEKSWVESSIDPNRKVLSNKAISDLRSAIHKYRKERNEQLVPVVTAITGLVGALIGLVALFAGKSC